MFLKIETQWFLISLPLWFFETGGYADVRDLNVLNEGSTDNNVVVTVVDATKSLEEKSE